MWFKVKEQQVVLTVLAKPNAKKTALVAITDHELKISLHAKPHHGEANKELISFLAQLFRVPKTEIILKRGEKSNHKQVIIPLIGKVQEFLNDPTKFI